MEIDLEEFARKVQQMYPEQFGRVIAELRAEKAEARVAELEQAIRAGDAPAIGSDEPDDEGGEQA